MTGFEDEEGRVRGRRSDGERPYGAFLLRCWQEESGWRYSLEAIGSDAGERRRQGFSSLDAFLASLQSELARLRDLADDASTQSRQ